MIDFKIDLIDKSLYQKDFTEHNDIQKEEDAQSNFDKERILILFDDFCHNVNDNHTDMLPGSIESIIEFIDNSNPIIVNEIKEHSQISKNNIIDIAMTLIINPPILDQKDIYLNLIISLLSIKNAEITEYIISNSDYIQFFDSNLFQCNDITMMVQIIIIISLIAEHLTTLNVRFVKLFPSFTYDRIISIFKLISKDPKIIEIFIQMISKLCTNLVYGELYYKLVDFLLENYQLNYDPFFLFNVLIMYMKKYSKSALDLISEKKFLFGEVGHPSVFDFLSSETFNYGDEIYYKYCFYTLKFLYTCVKKLDNDVVEEIFKSLPVDDVCDLIFDENASHELICIALKILITDYLSVNNQNDDDFNPKIENENEEQQNQSFFVDHRNDEQPNQSFFGGNENDEQQIHSYFGGNENDEQQIHSYFDGNENDEQQNQSFFDGNENDEQQNQNFFDGNENDEQQIHSYFDGNENDEQQNQSFFDGNENDEQQNHSYFDGNENFPIDPNEQHFLPEEESAPPPPRQKPNKDYILDYFYEKVRNSGKICQMFLDGNFKLKYLLLNMVKLTIKALLHTGSPRCSNSDQNDVALDFLEPYLIQIIAEMLLTGDQKLSALVIEFLDILIMKAMTMKVYDLIELVSNKIVVDCLIDFIDMSDEPNSDIVQTAKNILSVIQGEHE